MMGLWIGEILCQNWAIAKGIKPLGGPGAKCRAHVHGSQIGKGTLGWKEEEQSTVLDDEFETLNALGSAPAHPKIAILRDIAGRTPSQQGQRFSVKFDDLQEEVPNGG